MYKRGFEQQGVSCNQTTIYEFTFWNSSDRKQMVRFYLQTKTKCLCCEGCYSVDELIVDKVVVKGLRSCQWLRDPKLVKIQMLRKELFQAQEIVRKCQEELKKLL
jgi:hypothetical protein